MDFWPLNVGPHLSRFVRKDVLLAFCLEQEGWVPNCRCYYRYDPAICPSPLTISEGLKRSAVEGPVHLIYGINKLNERYAYNK
jgi:hypothetical protein